MTNRNMIFLPKYDGSYVVEFRTANGETLAISIPRNETAVIQHQGTDAVWLLYRRWWRSREISGANRSVTVGDHPAIVGRIRADMYRIPNAPSHGRANPAGAFRSVCDA